MGLKRERIDMLPSAPICSLTFPFVLIYYHEPDKASLKK